MAGLPKPLVLLGCVVGGVVAVEAAARTYAASPAERRAEMPGDDIVGRPQTVITRAITIPAPRFVWPCADQLVLGVRAHADHRRARDPVGLPVAGKNVALVADPRKSAPGGASRSCHVPRHAAGPACPGGRLLDPRPHAELSFVGRGG